MKLLDGAQEPFYCIGCKYRNDCIAEHAYRDFDQENCQRLKEEKAEFGSRHKQKKVVCVSGGFDPLHIGHLRNIKEAKKLGDYLILILTRDEQLIQKKGYTFMPYEERKEILESLKWVDEVVENIDKDLSSKESLKLYKPDIFAKGGDRTPNNMPLEEIEMCKKINCEIVYGIGGDKIQSSSELAKKSFNNTIKKI